MISFRSLPMTSVKAPPLPIPGGHAAAQRPPILNLGAIRTHRHRGCLAMNDNRSEIYSHEMTIAMGADLTYRHELGMNYNFIYPRLIVGSCLQDPSDVDKLRKIGVNTIFCLQQDPDLEYFGIDIGAIRKYCTECDDIEHLRADIRDFDAFDLRLRLPEVVSKLYQAINRNGGVTYVHCTAGLGRSPSVALAYLFWVECYKLYEGHQLLQSKRPCCPKLDAIKNATMDMLLGLSETRVTLSWKGGECSSVEVSGLDIGWGQRIPLEFNKDEGLWILEKDLPAGRYEYKYIVDGQWMFNKDEPLTSTISGHINNYVEVFNNDEASAEAKELKERLSGENVDVDLTKDERANIRKVMESY